ncbi:MAG: hypothetical protein ACR2FY_14660 [Pirellulaceae bacterium]
MPGTQKNQNAARHGLVAGRLPPGFRSITACVSQLRKGLEAAVIAARSEVSITDASFLNSAVRWETHSLLCLRQLRDHFKDLGPLDIARLSEQSAAASSKRDQCIEKLNLPSGDGSDWNPAYLYRQTYATSVQDSLPKPPQPKTASWHHLGPLNRF